MIAVWIILAIIVLILLWAWLLGEYMLRKFFVREKDEARSEAVFNQVISKGPNSDKMPRIREGRQWLAAQPYEDVYIESYDGLRLHGRLYLNPKSTGDTILLVHGYKSTYERDFSCGCPFYFSMGFNILLVDQRSHGQSEGRYICFGARERYDVVKWARWMVDRFGPDKKYVMGGMSMGCTSVLLAAALPELPKEIRGVIADCGFTSAYQEFRHVLKKSRGLPPFPLLNIAEFMCRRRAGFGFRDASTEDAMKDIRIPVFFVHGEADTFVLPEYTKRNFELCGSEKKKLLLVPGADHGMSFLVDETRYTGELEAFFRAL